MDASLSSPNLPFTNVKVSTIRPLQKRGHVDTIDATFLDLQNQDICFPLLFAFRLAVKSESLFSQQVERIKESLQQVLVSFFSYAGRWISDPVICSKRKLLCNDEGVPFIEAYLDRDLDSVVKLSAAFQPVPELQGFGFLGLDMTQFKQQMPPGGLPCMFVQITRFKCGGVAFAVTFNHTLTDGTGFVKFMQAWVASNNTNQVKTFEVDHDRAKIEAPSMKTSFSGSTQKSNTSSLNGANNGAAPGPLQGRTWVMKSFEVSVSTIAAIKQEGKERQGGAYVSTVDCIAAHLWKSLARIPSSILGGKDVLVVSTVEGRTRFYDTPLSNVSANVLSHELREMPLTSIASKLRDTLQRTRREEWLDLEKFESFTSNEFAAMQVISWLRFPVYTLDFGWGKPVLCSLNTFMYFNDRLGKVYLTPPLPSSPSSIATVQIFSSHGVIEALEQDPNFQAFFMAPQH
ncbi:unnamed protein product [Calypogeia fissa]